MAKDKLPVRLQSKIMYYFNWFSCCKMIQGRIQVGQKIGAEVFPLPNLGVSAWLGTALCLGTGMREIMDQREKDRR